MATHKHYTVNTITEYHRVFGLPAPEHPLISIVDYAKLIHSGKEETISMVFGYYVISLKRGVNKMRYGQQEYDFDEGILYFMAPGQVLTVTNNSKDDVKRSGWLLLIHPDFLWNSPLAGKIKQYEFFDYTVNEALFLSEKEEDILNNIIHNIRGEYQTNLDKFSRDIIIAQTETLLSYAERYYQRQFITRNKSNHLVLGRMEKLLDDYFNADDLITKGLPTVQSVADTLNISPGYLSGLLKLLTGQSTQQHIHEKLISKAKEKLSATDLSVSEIAYELGFAHPQSFSKLFKTKTNVSPLEFRHSFN